SESMRIVCPKCDLKGQVDAAPKGAKTRIACVRCATTFDAVFVDGEIQALLPQANRAEALVESAGSEVSAESDVSVAGAEFAYAPETAHEDQENPFDASTQIEASPVSADDFFTSSTSSTDLMSDASVETMQDAPEEISPEATPQSFETGAHETADAVQASVVVAQSLKSGGGGKVGHQPSDAYGMGVRLMRVSPLWLLVTGLSFISFIVFCNWLIKPMGQPKDSLIAAANNHATNQTVNRVNVPASTTQSPVNSQVGQRANESGVAFIAAEAKEAMPHAAPSVEPAGLRPEAEAKPATPASSSNRADEAKEGKVTIQIGSYNAAAEAEARVANLKSAGFEARSVAVEIPKRGTWYRVQSGRFVSRDEAERYGKQLRDKGVVSSFITTDMQE
ncbi:MAG TPA: SPOR domain-containing protein, partial [Pyrinomonadaceae bacterium]